MTFRARSARQRRPVFLHAGWRTSSTYVWSRFRRLDGVRAYYEPFNEGLARLTHASVRQARTDSWTSGHPALELPYFHEYRLLLDSEGVAGFDVRFGYEFYSITSGAQLQPQRRYLETLVREAEADGATAVLGFCRSTARTAWFRKQFPEAMHVYQRRNPVAQFASYRRQFEELGNPYFLAVNALVVAAAPAGSPFAAVRASLRLPDLSGGVFDDQYDECVQLANRMSVANSYRVFAFVHTYGDWHSRQHSDLVLDVDGLTTDQLYRRRAEQWFAVRTGLAPSFEGARAPARRDLLTGVDPGWGDALRWLGLMAHDSRQRAALQRTARALASGRP